MNSNFQSTLKKYQKKELDVKTAKTMGKPWSDPKTALSKKEKALLESLIKQIESGEIDLFKPSSIVHQKVYQTLKPEDKAKADLWIQATLALLRRIYDFYKNPYDNNSDMMIDMMRDLSMKKEMLEEELGDVLKL